MIVAATVFTLSAAGCAASYSDRMKFLDEMSTKGIEYRGQLQQQNTPPDEAACKIGWRLLDADVPYDTDEGGVTPEWKAEVQEAYVKSCITGEALPKPDPSGVSARTPVPFSSAAPTVKAS